MVSSCATVAWTLSPARIWWMLATCGPGLKVAVAPSEKSRTMKRRSASIDCTVTRCLTDSTGIALWIRRASPLGCTLAVGAVQHPAKASAMTRSRSVTIARLSVWVLIVGIMLILSPVIDSPGIRSLRARGFSNNATPSAPEGSSHRGKRAACGDVLLTEPQDVVFVQGDTRRAIDSIAACHVHQARCPALRRRNRGRAQSIPPPIIHRKAACLVPTTSPTKRTGHVRLGVGRVHASLHDHAADPQS